MGISTPKKAKFWRKISENIEKLFDRHLLMIYFTKCKIYLSVVILILRKEKKWGAHDKWSKANMTSLTERLQIAPPIKRYRIGEVSHFSGLSRQTVHNYTIMGLITEQEWTEGGHRLYDESVFEALARIEQLKRTMSLREIRELLDREQSAPNVNVS